MSEDKVEISKELLEKFFKVANVDVPENITDDNILNAISKIQKPESSDIKENPLKEDGNEKSDDTNSDATKKTKSKNILVIDDIGVVTYQLRLLLQNLGYNVNIAKDIFSGINSFVHSSYSFVIMDLFVSTEQEGYTLLNETKKIITQNNLNTKIVVITASNKAENKIRCLNGGADYFIKKDAGWQDKIIELIELNETK